ncbi:helix-turn-helix domain-containing protein [Dehalococcoidia bacterium]|nr:helix-turn-helix domain-containing protein [Dehalococcoidia bacterium]
MTLSEPHGYAVVSDDPAGGSFFVGVDMRVSRPTYLDGKLTVLEAAKLTGRHQETIRRWVRDGRLEADKLGLVWHIDAHHLRNLMEGHVD